MPSDLTGLWQSDDGGTYYLRQFQDHSDLVLWWAGLSRNGTFQDGLTFSNVYRGKVIGQSIFGEWSDVPRGQTANHGALNLLFVDGSDIEQRLQKTDSTGGFGGSLWTRLTLFSPGATVAPRTVATLSDSADVLLATALKNVVKGGHIDEKETLKDNLYFLRDSVCVFGTVVAFGDHKKQAVTVGYPSDRGRTYDDFICLNGSSFLGILDQEDADVTFECQVDVDQINTRQPDFFARGWSDPSQIRNAQTLLEAPIEGEIIMFGKVADCGDEGNNDAPSLFPGWGEADGNAVLFNGRPISVPSLPPGVGTLTPNFLNELSFGDRIRVTGVLAFDIGHGDNPGPHAKLEIHPVYSVEKISTSSEKDLSGVYGDDFGNTYFLRHYQDTRSVWYLGLSPLGSERFGQVFNGTVDPNAHTIVGTLVALPFGPRNIGVAPFQPFGFDPATPLGDTGSLTFDITQPIGPGGIVRSGTTLSVGRLRLMKLYDV
jgi:hypothetical protein